MTRIFLFGESHVRYNYPTWADVLLEDYNGYNCGEIGCSNQLIAQRLTECNNRYKFSKNDIIIINWANFFREDRYHTGKGWHCAGNVFHNLHLTPFVLNNYRYSTDAEWADLHYFLYRDLCTISLVQTLLKNIESTVIQTHTGNFYEDNQLLEIPGVKKILDFFKDSIVFDVLSVQEYNIPNYNENTRPKYTYNNKDYFVEDHPLPGEHLEWLEKIILPICNLNLSQETISWCKEWDKIIKEQKYIKYPTNWISKTPDWIV